MASCHLLSFRLPPSCFTWPFTDTVLGWSRSYVMIMRHVCNPFVITSCPVPISRSPFSILRVILYWNFNECSSLCSQLPPSVPPPWILLHYTMAAPSGSAVSLNVFFNFLSFHLPKGLLWLPYLILSTLLLVSLFPTHGKKESSDSV